LKSPQTKHGDAPLHASSLVENVVELTLQLLPVRQTGQGVVLGHAIQAAFSLLTQVHVVFDGGEQAVGRFHPQAQLVALMPTDHRQLVLAGPVGVDPRQMLDELGQRTGQQPLVDQEEHEAQRQRTQDADDEDHDGVVDEFLAISGRVQSDAQLAVILVVRRFADQRSREL